MSMILKRFRKHYLYRYIDKIAFKYDLKRRADFSNDRCANYDGMYLTKEEKAKIKEIWGEWGGDYKSYGAFLKIACNFYLKFNKIHIINKLENS